MKQILLADDQELVRTGIASMINASPECQVIAEAQSGPEAVRLYKRHRPDLVLMDVRMPGGSGLEATKEILAWDPGARVLILTTFQDDEYVMSALQMGAAGYLLKDTNAPRLFHAMKQALAGGLCLDETVAAQLMPSLLSNEPAGTDTPETPIPSLTLRERELIRLVGEGLNNREIAETLHLSLGTVKNQITRLLDKLDLRDRTQLAIFGIRNNLV